MSTRGPSSLPAAPRNRSPLPSGSASSEAVPERRARRMRGRTRRRSMDVTAGMCPQVCLSVPARRSRCGDQSVRQGKDSSSQVGHIHAHSESSVSAAAQDSSIPASNSATLETVSKLRSWKKRVQKRNIWTVNHVEGMKFRMNKRRRPSYRPEDQEAFYRLLEDPVIQSFLEADIFLKVSDKYLLSMVVEYFGRVGLPGHLYNRIHFFLALYIASDMEEDNPTSKRSIFQFLLGREHWPELYKEFLKLKVEFFHAMGHRAWVTPELCEEIQAQNPHHWVWSRERQCAP
ncbi:putative speedy protein E7 [Meles meles]|uniref:putative speedy protein E7 n=1 Tax=Meles meles TaxID=9662 RepID=UPI001E69B2A1|nr:putative speedy protein E7 [Meles meles]